MALSRQKKEQVLQAYADRLRRSQVMIWANYQGLTMPQISDLRRQLRGASSETVVVKNTLMRLALEQANLPVDSEIMLGGPRVVTFVYDNIADAAKMVTGFARANEAVFQIKGGLVNGQVVGADQVQALTLLPPREVLLARVVGGIQSPLSGLVGTLAAIVRGIVNVLDARRKQLEGSPS